MSFRLVPKSVTLNDFERRNGLFCAISANSGSFRGALRKSSRSLAHLLMSSCNVSQDITLGINARYSDVFDLDWLKI